MNIKERNRFGLTGRDMKTLFNIFEKYPVVKKIFIYGSRATGNYKQGSDIDLAIMNACKEELFICKMKCEIEESSIPFAVDIANYNAIKHCELKDHIDGLALFFMRAA